MTKPNHLCRVWDIIEKVGVCMLTTQFSGGLRARPIEARADRDAGLIFFVTDVHSAKDDEINAAPDVGLVLMPPAYVQPYVKKYKNDATDAEATCKAVARLNMRFVATKTPVQRSCLTLHRIHYVTD